jgi:uncharacterized protein YegL
MTDLSVNYRPVIFLLTDGIPEPPHQDIDGAIAVLQRHAFSDMRRPAFFFYAIGINDADDDLMREIVAPEAYYSLKGISLTTIMEIVTVTANQTAGYVATQLAVDSYLRGARGLGE